MHGNRDDMYSMGKLWGPLFAAVVAVGGCGDDGEGTDTGATTTPTTGMTDTDATDTDATGTDASDETGAAESSGGDEIDCTTPPSHATDIQPLWDANCVDGCHEPGGNWPTTDLTSGMAYDMLVEADGIQTMALTDIQLVIPEDIENSYLVNKLRNTQVDVAGAAAGTQMPQGLPPLSEDDISLVEQWIFCGAEP